MKFEPVMSLGLSLALAATCAGPAWAQDGDTCRPAEAAKPAKKRGLGGLLKAVRSSGLEGAVAGALRGEGNLASDLSGAARAAAEREIANAAAGAPCDDDGSVEAQAEQDAAPKAGGARLAAAYPSRMEKLATVAAQKRAYDDFGKVRCMECEGGFAYDGWAVFARDEFSSKYNGDAQRIGSWPVGHVHRWDGSEARGTLTVSAEETVDGFRCKRVVYRLEKNAASAERPGLYCWGKLNEYAGSDSWVEVY